MSVPFPRRRATKLRHPDIVAAYWYEYVLGEDEHGEWAILPAGGRTWFAVGDVSRIGDDQLRCYPRHGNWVAQFWQPDRILHVDRADGRTETIQVELLDYVDMTAPPTFEGADVSFVDLVLDVVRYPDGRVAVLDEDEVDEEVERYGIPPEYIERARISCAEVHDLMSAGKAPFDGTAESWRARFHASVPAG
ncbi:DUF402 domain-containing protein [Phytomonospora endophytica]|uniref:DUF402 domain-containing protein n=1 Tax=Phytomonospora endophytica TaxID=714109 RepID=A0A841FHQ8_9ACTN|nr:DUF402 domain-containing protein [Phytomonospora endophytica]MBB6035404.1 hypothetical protein [Phytomonospora endophytica]